MIYFKIRVTLRDDKAGRESGYDGDDGDDAREGPRYVCECVAVLFAPDR